MRTKLRVLLAGERRRRDDVHFHTDGAGRPFVCDHARCDSARLTAGELAATR